MFTSSKLIVFVEKVSNLQLLYPNKDEQQFNLTLRYLIIYSLATIKVLEREY